jgi:hypothetical protein
LTRQERSLKAVHARLFHRVRDLGKLPVKLAWAPPEIQVMEQYARRFIQGRFHTTLQTANAARRDLERLRRENPDAPWARMQRTRQAILQKLHERVVASGQTWSNAGFLPVEDRILNHYAKAFMRGQYPTLTRAGRACWKELKLTVGEITRRKLGLPATRASRTLRAVTTQLELRTIALGRPKLAPRVTFREKVIARRWARRYLSALAEDRRLPRAQAIRAMKDELLAGNYPRRPEQGYRGMFEKLLPTLASGRSRPNQRWQPEENQIAEKWTRNYRAGRRRGVGPTRDDAIREMKAELQKHGYVRPGEGCRSRLEKILQTLDRARATS